MRKQHNRKAVLRISFSGVDLKARAVPGARQPRILTDNVATDGGDLPLNPLREPVARPAQPVEVERLVAVGRMILAVFLLMVLFVDRAVSHTAFATTLRVAYAMYALTLTFLTHRNRHPERPLQIARHTIDLFIVSVLILMTDGTNSLFESSPGHARLEIELPLTPLGVPS